MQPPGSQLSINVCATIQCPFFKFKSNSGGCPRYAQACQCHLTTVANVQSDTDEYWLFTVNESELQQLKKLNDRFLAKDKSSQRQLKQLAMRTSQSQGKSVDKRVSSSLEVGIPTGG